MSSIGGNGDTLAPAGRGWVTALLLVLAVALAARLCFAARHDIDFDGYWHVFIARELPLSAAARDMAGQAHPPLFYLLLRLSRPLGHSSFALRAPSIASGLAACALAFWLVRRLGGSGEAALLAALVCAVSEAAVVVSCEVRSYMLAVALVMAALAPLASLSGLARTPPGRWAPAAMATLASAAVLSHYGAVLSVAACLAAPAVLAAVCPAYAPVLRRAVREHGRALLAGAAAPAIVALACFAVHVRPQPWRLGHLEEFRFVRGVDSPIAYLTTGLARLLALFWPYPISPAGTFTQLLAWSGVAAVVGTLAAARLGLLAPWRALPAALLVLQTGAHAAAALLGAYPFGGPLRHQFFLFPWLVLMVAAVADLLLSRLRPVTRGIAVAAAGAALLAHAVAWPALQPATPGQALSSMFEGFQQAYPAPPPILVDELNLVRLFSRTRDWSWRRMAGELAPGVDTYEVTKDGRRLLVVRNRRRISANFFLPDLHRDVRELLTRLRGQPLVAYAVQASALPHVDAAQPAQLRALRAVAEREGVSVAGRIAGGWLYPEFTLARRVRP